MFLMRTTDSPVTDTLFALRRRVRRMRAVSEPTLSTCMREHTKAASRHERSLLG
jgi:hypothetical protein